MNELLLTKNEKEATLILNESEIRLFRSNTISNLEDSLKNKKFRI